MTKKRIILLLGFGVVVTVVIWILVLSYTGGISTLLELLPFASSKMAVQIQAPPSVRVGDEITLVVNIENLDDEVLEIDEFLIPNELLRVAVVTAIFPGSTNQYDRGEMTGFEIGYAIAPADRMVFTITLQAMSSTDFLGEIQIRSGMSRETIGTRVVILGPGGEPAYEPDIPETEFGPNVPYLSVVKITANHLVDGQMVQGWSGSGSIISRDGLILTNAHVVLSGRFFPVDELVISLTLEPDQLPVPMYHAEVMQADRSLDLAVIILTTDLENNPVDRSQLDLPAVEMGDAGRLQLGDPLTILGYPGIGGDTITLTRGEVGGFTSEPDYGDRAYIKTSATIAGGNSGGLVADERGFLIGIPTQLGSGGDDVLIDCRVIADTNRDGEINSLDGCVPAGGFINVLRPINLAVPLIEAALRGEFDVIEFAQTDIPLPVGGILLYSDDFSSQTTGWDHGGSAEGVVGYHNGEYRVEVKAPNYVFWGTANQMFDNVVITVRTRIITPAVGADYGVICRYQDDDNFYAMSITEDQYAAIWKIENGVHTLLMDWVFSQDIPRYDPATITASCRGDELTLAVNGVVLGSVRDSSFATGDVGLFGGVWDDPGFTIAFDNIEVKLH